MSERLAFEIVCPNDHDQTVACSRDEFEKTLKSGGHVVHCNTGETNRPTSQDGMAKLRKARANARP